MPNATIHARHLIDPANNRVLVLGPHSDDEHYTWVRFEDGTEDAFPNDSITLDDLDTGALTDTELRQQTDDALAALDEPADFPAVAGERESRHLVVHALVDEAHGRAYADHVRMYVRLLPDQTLRSMAAFAELVDQTSPRTEIATQVVRDLLHERNYLVDGAWRCNCHAGNAAPGADFPRCGAGVSQWR